jgi:hypothetical protein
MLAASFRPEKARCDSPRRQKLLPRCQHPLLKSSGSLPLEGRAGEGVEAGTHFYHPSLTLPIKGRGPEE